jgi:cysteinyl-tRNA synthetase
MSVRFYNTLTKKKEEFVPLEAGKVGMYVCGITAYDMCHIGHARSALVFDFIFKYFKYRGYNVTYVKNFTDVDDKIIAKANGEGKDISEISERYIKEHNEDMDRFGIARPTMTPKATENIQGMVRLISMLIEKGLAYVVDGDVYFSVDKYDQYGKLSGRNIEEMVAGARIDIDEKKTNPLDFILWKAAKEGEPWWDSPWGRGRPGWHIECSVMSQRFLGTTFDIHGGGRDLVFPHHENEIAQAEGATGETFARYWIHNGFIRVNEEKMSKSLGNIFNMREAMNQCHPEVLRLFMLQSHYRSPVDLSDESLSEARLGMQRFYGTLGNIKRYLAADVDLSALTPKSLTASDQAVFEKVSTLPERFTEAMDDDFNTARALGYIFDVVRLINGYYSDRKFKPTPGALYVLKAAMKVIREVGKVLGLFLEDPDDYFAQDKKREAAKRGLDIDEIDRLVEERREARAAGNWSRADEIRDLLVSKKIILQDTADTTIWTIG